MWFACAGVFSSPCALLQSWSSLLPEQRQKLFWSSRGCACSAGLLVILCLQAVLSLSVSSALCWGLGLTASLGMPTSGRASGRRERILPPSKWSKPFSVHCKLEVLWIWVPEMWIPCDS